MDWYIDVFGVKLMMPIMKLDRSTMPDAPAFTVYPQSLQAFDVAFLTFGQGPVLELFEFKNPKMKLGEEFNFSRDYNKGGFFHLAITTDDVEGLCEKIFEKGGRKVGPLMQPFQYNCYYVEDKWGNVLELMDFTLEDVVKAVQSPVEK